MGGPEYRLPIFELVFRKILKSPVTSQKSLREVLWGKVNKQVAELCVPPRKTGRFKGIDLVLSSSRPEFLSE